MPQSPMLDKFKVWAFPGLISVLAAIIWQDVKEIKSDVKALIAQSADNKARIENLERLVYEKNKGLAKNTIPQQEPKEFYPVVFVAPKQEWEESDDNQNTAP